MNVAWPGALLALFALALPVAIHVLQQGQHRTVDIATTRFLRNSTRQRWRRLAVDRPLLLALRCLLLAASALLLAEPFTTPDSNIEREQAGWVVVSPDVPPDTARSLTGGGNAQWRWLGEDFPDIDASPPPMPPKDAWSLVAEADATLPAGRALTVVMPADGALLGAQRPPLSRPVEWLLVPASIDASAVALPAVMVAFDSHREADARWLEEAFGAWSDAGLPVELQIVQRDAVSNLAPWTLWLSDADTPQPEASSTSHTVVTDRATAPGIATESHGDVPPAWQLTRWWDGPVRRLNVGAGLTANASVTGDAQFAERLLGMLAADRVRRPPNGYPLTAAQLAGTAAGDRPTAAARQDLTALFALLVAALWCAERVFSAWPFTRVQHD